MITTKKLSDVPIMKNAHNVDARNLHSSENAVIVVITLQPGQHLKKHITPVDVVFYGLKGSGFVHIGEETINLTENQLVESPKNIVHFLSNDSDDDFQFMVIKTPRPQKQTVFVS